MLRIFRKISLIRGALVGSQLDAEIQDANIQFASDIDRLLLLQKILSAAGLRRGFYCIVFTGLFGKKMMQRKPAQSLRSIAIS